MMMITDNETNGKTDSKIADLVSAVSSEYLALIRIDLRSASSLIRSSLVAALPLARSQCRCVPVYKTQHTLHDIFSSHYVTH